MAGYAVQNVDCDASISVEAAPHYDSLVQIEVEGGSAFTAAIDLDAEDAWHFAWKVIEAANDASPELIGALTERLHELGGAS